MCEFTRYAGNPILGGVLGTCFDMSVDVANGRYRMWFSWRTHRGIGYAESADGLHWEVRDTVVLGPEPSIEAEHLEVTRPFVLVDDGQLTMWYAAHGEDRVAIARATSFDGISWQRQGVVLDPREPWEKAAIMCPSVLRDHDGTYHMWYSGGERVEPDAIGYATSPDGIRWTRVTDVPVLTARPGSSWESHRVAGAHVFRLDEWLYAAYIGFANEFDDSSVGVARSRDGIDWHRHAGNPVITHGEPGQFDSINVYKPFVVVDGETWRVWFNGSTSISGDTRADDQDPRFSYENPDRIEQIGYASARFKFKPT